MTTASLSLPLNVVRSIVSREESGDDRYESQDNPGHDDFETLRQTEAVYHRTLRRKHRRRKAVVPTYESSSYGD